MCLKGSIAASSENTRLTHVGMGDKVGWTEEPSQVEKSRVVTSSLFSARLYMLKCFDP